MCGHGENLVPDSRLQLDKITIVVLLLLGSITTDLVRTSRVGHLRDKESLKRMSTTAEPGNVVVGRKSIT